MKDVLTYGGGTIFGYAAFLSLLIQLTQDINLIILYTLILIIFLWLVFIQIKLSKQKGGDI